jgi:protein-S-isoprenylcysteine O-methyltransferase Ste14
MQVFLKIYLPVYLLIYLAVAFILPSFRTWKQTGINPVTFGKEDTAHNYIGFIMKLLIALLFFMTLVYSLCHRLYNYLLPVWYLENQFVIIAGLAIIHVALIWIMIAQFQMSNSWRIGIDEKNKTQLVTKGIFSISRNPIFLGMIITVFGFFLILPNALSFFLVLTSYFIIQIQIRLEEEFLERQHRDTYKDYKSKTRRLI